jgi:hypothetical protein
LNLDDLSAVLMEFRSASWHEMTVTAEVIEVAAGFEVGEANEDLATRLERWKRLTRAFFASPKAPSRVCVLGGASLKFSFLGQTPVLSFALPEAFILDRFAAAHLQIPARAIKATFAAEQIVTEYADFVLEYATHRVVRIMEEFGIIAELRFLPKRTGRLQLPHLSILFPNLEVRIKARPKAARIKPTSRRSQKSRNRVSVPTEDAEIHVSSLMYSVSPSGNVRSSISLVDRSPIARSGTSATLLLSITVISNASSHPRWGCDNRRPSTSAGAVGPSGAPRRCRFQGQRPRSGS